MGCGGGNSVSEGFCEALGVEFDLLEVVIESGRGRFGFGGVSAPCAVVSVVGLVSTVK